MIQRIQTLWLLAAAICAFLALKFSFYSGILINPSVPTTTPAAADQFHELNGMENFFLNLTTITTGILSLGAIFMYKQRTLQQRICLAALGTELLVLLGYYLAIKNYSKGSVSFMAILQIAIVVSLVLAILGIRKDAAIIAESDRLR